MGHRQKKRTTNGKLLLLSALYHFFIEHNRGCPQAGATPRPRFGTLWRNVVCVLAAEHHRQLVVGLAAGAERLYKP